MANRLVETTVNLIVNELKSKLPAALADIRTDRADAKVTTEPPRSYFIYPNAKSYQAPSVFVIPDQIDFLKESRGANFISAQTRVMVAVLIEDFKEDFLTIKSWRYQAALHQVLDQVRLTDADEQVTIVVIVKRATFSGIEGKTSSSGPEQVFRREVVLECDVEHWEPAAA